MLIWSAESEVELYYSVYSYLVKLTISFYILGIINIQDLLVSLNQGLVFKIISSSQYSVLIDQL